MKVNEYEIKPRANLEGANLRGANLRGADLRGADLRGADLRGADLEGANLRGANLRGAYLRGAYLRGANLEGADLRGANLEGAYLRGANLEDANLEDAYLRGADLEDVKIKFTHFPSISFLSNIFLGSLSERLSMELMRRDAEAHPFPEKFEDWARGGECPYQNEMRFWLFKENKAFWKSGEPKMSDSELIKTICKEKGWEIEGY